jgi:hypothetical protein
MTLEDTIILDEAIAEAEGLLDAGQWYWIQASEQAYWQDFYKSVGFN